MEYWIISLAVLLPATAFFYIYVFKREAADNYLKLIQCFLIWGLPLIVAIFIYLINMVLNGFIEEDEPLSGHDIDDFGASRLKYNY